MTDSVRVKDFYTIQRGLDELRTKNILHLQYIILATVLGIQLYLLPVFFATESFEVRAVITFAPMLFALVIVVIPMLPLTENGEEEYRQREEKLQAKYEAE